MCKFSLVQPSEFTTLLPLIGLIKYIYSILGDGAPPCSCSSNQNRLEIVKSKRGKRVLLRAGYRYHKRRINKDGSTKWLCTERNVCKAILLTASDGSILKEDRHNCEPDFVSNELRLEMDKCEQKVTTDYSIPIPSVVREAVGQIKDKGLDIVKKLPNKNILERKLYRKRNQSLGVKKVRFNSLTDIIIPPRFETFLLADYCQSSTRIIIFAGEYCREILKKPNLTVFCDGTFKFCLKPFAQMYTLHVDLGSTDTHRNIIPVIYALLPNKTTNIYVTLFRLIKSQIPEFDPHIIILDFEQAPMLAVRRVYPQANIVGCYFHFCRSLWRKVEQLKINKKSKIIRKHIKRCTVLALLPREVIDNAWLYVMSQCPNDETLVLFNDYFVNTWLTETSFFADKWCVYDKEHRTTNMLESWHSTINKKNYKTPNNIATFLTLLEREDKYQQAIYLNGSVLTKKSKTTIEFDTNLVATLSEFRNGEINIDLCIERLIL